MDALVAGDVRCSKVAKVSVCPQALLDLRDQVRVFRLETRQSLLKGDPLQGPESWLEDSEGLQVCIQIIHLCYLQLSCLRDRRGTAAVYICVRRAADQTLSETTGSVMCCTHRDEQQSRLQLQLGPSESC